MACVETDAPDVDGLLCIDALIAGTVALMTAWADPCPQARLSAVDLRRVLARKVVTNLFFLQYHPRLRPELRQSLAQAHARWVGLAHHEPPAGRVLEAASQHALH
ncbi:MAG: hypothetical protein J0M20_06390 [Burkholderiales bacterium]|nr:hypothetical protein [Burkholderiales bacterium]